MKKLPHIFQALMVIGIILIILPQVFYKKPIDKLYAESGNDKEAAEAAYEAQRKKYFSVGRFGGVITFIGLIGYFITRDS